MGIKELAERLTEGIDVTLMHLDSRKDGTYKIVRSNYVKCGIV